MLNGRIGQVIGPFEQNADLLNDDGPIGVFTPQSSKPILYKLGIQADEGTIVEINDIPIRIGKTGIYELDSVVDIKSLKFMSDTSSDTIVDFVY